MNYFVTGIDTDSGKTLVSAILCEALEADYWKPVQAGLPKDSDVIKDLVTNSVTTIHPEAYCLKTPASPHAAAKIDGVEIRLSNFIIPKTKNTLIIEGAGGCLVPLNEKNFVIDLVPGFNARVILVADLYLGSINHTLLSIEALQKRKIDVLGIIFNGPANPESQSVILQHAQVRQLLHIQRENSLDKQVVKNYAAQLKSSWKNE
jgi:dethiobiotin synthetase